MRTLLIIAHPDDECMFFYPSISGLQRDGNDVYVLCLSKGNSDGLGELRICELYHSCSMLGIQHSKVMIVDDVDLQDGLQQHWDVCTVAKHVSEYVEKVEAEVLITFDQYGVSGHPNHTSVWSGVLSAWQNSRTFGGNMPLYTLKSSNLLVKYSGMFSFLIEPVVHASVGSTESSVSSVIFWNSDVRPVWQAMLCHKSQMTWYRRLFILLSQYSFNNRLVQVSPPKIHKI